MIKANSIRNRESNSTKDVFQQVAEANNTTVQKVRYEIQQAIDFAWGAGKMKQSGHFATKPTIEETIEKLIMLVANEA